MTQRLARNAAITLAALTALAMAQEKPEKPGNAPAEPAAAARGEVTTTPLDAKTVAAERRRAAETVIRAALRQRIDVEFKDVPLWEAIEQLGKEVGKNVFMVDRTALMEEGIPADEPVTLSQKQVTVGQVLHRILGPLDAGWLVDNERVKITASNVVAKALSSRSWSVSRLVQAMEAEQKRADEATDKEGQPTFEAGGPANLADAIRACTSGSWEASDGTGGTITLTGDALVVRQSQHVQEEVAGILRMLEAFLDGRIKHGAAEFSPEWSPAADDARIRKALAESAPEIDFVDVPLVEAARFFAKQLEVPICVDTSELMQEGIASDEPITFAAKEIAAESALGLILEPLGLTAVVDRGFLVVTTQVKADEMQSAMLYDVRDILDSGIASDALIKLLQQETGGPWESIDGSGGEARMALRGALLVWQTQQVHRELATLLSDFRETMAAAKAERAAKPATPEKPTPVPQAESPETVETRYYPFTRRGVASDLRTTIPTIVAAKTWKENGGEGVIQSVGDTLIVRNTRLVHKQVRKFLDDLKTAEESPPKN